MPLATVRVLDKWNHQRHIGDLMLVQEMYFFRQILFCTLQRPEKRSIRQEDFDLHRQLKMRPRMLSRMVAQTRRAKGKTTCRLKQ